MLRNVWDLFALYSKLFPYCCFFCCGQGVIVLVRKSRGCRTGRWRWFLFRGVRLPRVVSATYLLRYESSLRSAPRKSGPFYAWGLSCGNGSNAGSVVIRCHWYGMGRIRYQRRGDGVRRDKEMYAAVRKWNSAFNYVRLGNIFKVEMPKIPNCSF